MKQSFVSRLTQAAALCITAEHARRFWRMAGLSTEAMTNRQKTDFHSHEWNRLDKEADDVSYEALTSLLIAVGGLTAFTASLFLTPTSSKSRDILSAILKCGLYEGAIVVSKACRKTLGEIERELGLLGT